MSGKVLSDMRARDPAGGLVAAFRFSKERVQHSVRRILRENVLCAIATAGPVNRIHINTAYFSFSDAFELFFLSHPESRHCRNLRLNPRVAVAVFSSRQEWVGPDRGLQLFGRCSRARGQRANIAERSYSARFREYAQWKKGTQTGGSLAMNYRFYRVVVSRFKLLDEREFGDGVFVQATVKSSGAASQPLQPPIGAGALRSFGGTVGAARG